MTIGYNAHAFTVIDLSVTESTIYLSAHAVSGFGGLDSAKPLSALLAEVTGDGLYKTFDWSDNTFKRTGIADSRHEMDQVDLVSEEGVDSGMRHLSLDRSYLEEGKPYLFI
ncbi:MAG: hypothetical protein MPJ24_11315, partial [Pirellulaceae bacterium]|nr:hypothetical protein [Pirellulaceae bacterium]